jgi:hypothetical protein
MSTVNNPAPAKKSLAEVLNMVETAKQIIFVGVPEATNIIDRDNQPYYVCKLAEEITVRCSSDPMVIAHPATELYVRASALQRNDWVYLDETKPDAGFFIPGWVADFSKAQRIDIYQEKSIQQWARGERSAKIDQQIAEINAQLKAKINAGK